MERTKAERLAAKLDGMVSAKVLPGLLPEDVGAAAETLREQEAELKTLRSALVSKQHIVNVSVSKRQPYSKTVRGEFIIADPRIYYGEICVDELAAYMSKDQSEWLMHVARQLVRSASADWMRDLEERCYAGLRQAIATEARRAETTKIGSVHEGAGRQASPNLSSSGADNGRS